MAARPLPYSDPSARAELPLRTERHVPTSIAILERRIEVDIANVLWRCLCYQRPQLTWARPNV
jgi:hypothetical protein